MPKLVSDATVQATADSLAGLVEAQDRGVAVVLHGGEPLLLGAKRLDRVLSTLADALDGRSSLNIQTNGILISEPILDVCVKYGATLSVSLDGPAHVHDRHRVGHQNQPTHARVLEGIDILGSHAESKPLFSGLLAVVDPASNPAEVYHYLKAFGAPSIDFLCHDGNHSRLPFGKSDAQSTEYGHWLCQLSDIYLADSSPPRIRVIDDLIKLLLGGSCEKEGVGLTDFGIVVIDTDGSVTKNDTLKSAFDGADRFSEKWSVDTHALVDITASPEFLESHCLQRPTSSNCQSCRYLNVCGGGMPLHRWSDHNGYDNPSVYCADQQLLISHLESLYRQYIEAA